MSFINPYRFQTLSGPQLYQHYDATQGITLATGSDVSGWDDLSGNAFHGIQSDTTRQPTLVNSVQNGLAGIYFDNNTAGAQSYMLTGTLATNATWREEETVIGVARVVSGGTNGNFAPFGGITVFGKGSTTQQYIGNNPGDGYWYNWCGGGLVSTGSNAVNTTAIISARLSGISGTNNYDVERDNLGRNTQSNTSNVLANNYPLQIGVGTSGNTGARAGNTYFHGYIFEFKRFDGHLTDAEILTEVTALNTKWAVF